MKIIIGTIEYALSLFGTEDGSSLGLLKVVIQLMMYGNGHHDY